MKQLVRLSLTIDRINGVLGRSVSWMTLAMVLLGAFNAIARYTDRATGWNLSSNRWIEGQWYLFSLVFLLGAAATLRSDRHVRVDVIYGRLSKRTQLWIDLVGGLVFLLPFTIFALVLCWPAVSDSWAVRETSPDPGGLPRWPIKAVIPIAFGALILQGLSETIKRAAILRGYDPQEVHLDEQLDAQGDEEELGHGC